MTKTGNVVSFEDTSAATARLAFENAENMDNFSLVNETFTRKKKSLVFALLVFIQIFLNYDSGAIAFLLDLLQKEFGMNELQGGLMGSLVYIGLVISSAFSGWIFVRFNPKWVLLLATVANVVINTIFCFSPIMEVALFLRVLTGMSQAFLVIYAPVWVDEFAPDGLCTLWMSLMQGGVAIGIMVGYAVASLLHSVIPLPENASETEARIILMSPMLLQSAILGLLAVAFFFVPSEYIDTRLSCYVHQGVASAAADSSAPKKVLADYIVEAAEHDMEAIESGKKRRSKRIDIMLADKWSSIWASIKLLYTNALYMSGTLALCSLFFVVTGIQMWATKYFTEYVGISIGKVSIWFAACSATGPLIGVIAGGVILDRLGGYHGSENILRTTKFCGICAIGAVIPAYMCIFVGDNFYFSMAMLWLVLAFGGTIVPGATGVTISCVPKNMRSFASANATLIYNLFGYFAGPTVCGLVADAMGGVQYGFWIVLGSSALGLFFVAWAQFFARRNLYKQVLDDSLGDLAEAQHEYNLNVTDVDQEDVEYEIARGAGTFGLGQAIRRLSVALAFHEPQEEKVDKDYIVYSTTTDTPTLRRRRQTDSQLLGNARPLSLVNQQSLDGLDLGSNEK